MAKLSRLIATYILLLYSMTAVMVGFIVRGGFEGGLLFAFINLVIIGGCAALLFAENMPEKYENDREE